MQLSIIVPTYCEADNIRPLVARIRAALEPAVEYEIIVVDDNSRDGTDSQIAELQRARVPIRLVVRTQERGLSGAILRGLREARGEWLLNMDADMSHPPEAIPQMLRALQEQNADLVVGSRYVAGGGVEQGWGAYRWLNSLVALWLAKPLSKVRDNGAGFFLLPRRVFEAGRDLNPIGYKMLLEVMVKCPCHKVVEVPIQFADRKFGQSKLNFREQVLYLLHLKRLYDYKFGRRSRFIQFCVIGASGVVINLLVFSLLQKLGLAAKVAYALAIWVSLTWNFIPNRYLTFDLTAHHPPLPQYLRFGLTCLVGALVNWFVGTTLMTYSPWFAGHVYLAALAGIAAGTMFNFFLSQSWAFRHAAKMAE
jgi:dolichol-phosphate mannosyltransferase